MQVGAFLSFGSEALGALKTPANFLVQRLRGEHDGPESSMGRVSSPGSRQNSPEPPTPWELAYLAQHTALRAALGPAWQRWHRKLAGGESVPAPAPESLYRKRFHELLERDIAHVKAGDYPRSLLFDFPYGSFFTRARKGLRTMAGRIRQRHCPDEAEAEAESGHGPGAVRSPHRRRDPLPDYYRRNLHWPQDGWERSQSAELYDPSIEFLFLGTANIMRRMLLPPIVALGRPNVRVLDVGCGTGRFLRQLHTTLPSADLHGLDLNPNYLSYARRRLADIPWLSLSLGTAEEMLYRDDAFDVVTSIFVLHEVPPEIRRRMVQEMARVVRPGGRVILCDATQANDPDPRVGASLEWFPAHYHEPYYAGYVHDPLEALLENAGLHVERSEPNYLAKLVVARRPAPTGMN